MIDPERDAIVVAVSGGADSTVAAATVAASPPVGVPILFAYVDHGLRSDEAIELDQRVVAARAVAAGLPWVTLDARRAVAEHLRARRCGVEAAAREARYDALYATARRFAGEHARARALVITGHHRGDVAETVLYRLLSGRSPVSGLAIPARRLLSAGRHEEPGRTPDNGCNEVVLLRPFLQVARRAMREAAAAQVGQWSEDATNDDSSLDRARVRRLIAAMEGAGWREAEQHLARWGEQVDAATAQLAALLPDPAWGQAEATTHEWSRQTLGRLPPVARELVVRRALYALLDETRVDAKRVVSAVETLFHRGSHVSHDSGRESVADVTLTWTDSSVALSTRVVRPLQSGYLCLVDGAVTIAVDGPQPAIEGVFDASLSKVDHSWGPVDGPCILREPRAGDRLFFRGTRRALSRGVWWLLEDRHGIVLTVDSHGAVRPRDGVTTASAYAADAHHAVGLSVRLAKERRYAG